MASEIVFRVGSDESGERLDRLVARHAGVSRGQAGRWISSGIVRVRGRIIRVLSRRLHPGTVVVITLPADEDPDNKSQQEAPSIEILHLDSWLMAVSKPSGLLSESDQKGRISLEGLAPELLRARGERNLQVWLVHRLDAPTSGIILLARKRTAAKVLGQAFAAGKVKKQYLTLCTGVITEPVTIDVPIARKPGARHAVDPNGRHAMTIIEPIGSRNNVSLVRALPKTGRTHQIRLHLAHIGHPILGDDRYGGPSRIEEPEPRPIERLMLHAASLTISHPRTAERMTLSTPAPGDFSSITSLLGFGTSEL